MRLTYPDSDSGDTTMLRLIPEGESSDEQTDRHAWEGEQQEITTTKGINLHFHHFHHLDERIMGVVCTHCEHGGERKYPVQCTKAQRRSQSRNLADTGLKEDVGRVVGYPHLLSAKTCGKQIHLPITLRPQNCCPNITTQLASAAWRFRGMVNISTTRFLPLFISFSASSSTWM